MGLRVYKKGADTIMEEKEKKVDIVLTWQDAYDTNIPEYVLRLIWKASANEDLFSQISRDNLSAS